MKALLHQIVLIKIEKQIQKLVQKNQYLKNETILSNKYTEWKFTDFEQISFIINSKTIEMGGGKNNISTSTLQRIFGKKDTDKEYILKSKTKNIIALFLEYDSWENLETNIIQLIIDNITLDENLRNQISQTIAKKI